MKILIVSDIHANWEALQALPETYDRLFCLGDLVDYGPDPKACLRFIRDRAAIAVRGNHDHAVGYHADCRCTPAYRRLAETTRDATYALLEAEDLEFLRDLPEQVITDAGGVRFLLTHATVHDPMFGYLAAGEQEKWAAEIVHVDADVILAGHTHIAFARRYGSRYLINPGSVGQSKMLGGCAYCAMWEDGEVRLLSLPYAVSATAAKIEAWSAVPADVRRDLVDILRTGRQTG